MAYTLANAITATRRHLKDTTENVWTDADITAFVNEAILVIKDSVPEYFTDLDEVTNTTDEIDIDSRYTYLIPLFSSSRCFDQDEQFYRATKQMNEFEARLETATEKIYMSDAYATATTNVESESVEDVYSDTADSDDNVPELSP
jgi:hypothetical protein